MNRYKQHTSQSPSQLGHVKGVKDFRRNASPDVLSILALASQPFGLWPDLTKSSRVCVPFQAPGRRCGREWIRSFAALGSDSFTMMRHHAYSHDFSYCCGLALYHNGALS